MIVANSAVNRGGGINNESGSFKLYNTIVACNTANTGNDVYGTVSAYNCLSSYTAWGGSDNIEYDPNSPLFYNIENGDYRLAPGSQAIDMGNNQYAYNAGMDEFSTDIIGEPRFIGANIDIGAYESSDFRSSQRGIYVGNVILSWVQFENAVNVRLTWVSGTTRTVLGTFESVGEYTWDTTAFADGYGQLTVEYLDENGSAILSSTVTGLILNDDSVVVHRGDVSAPETWSADKVHLATGRLDVLSGGSVTVTQNAVVKFWKNAYISTKSGSTLTVEDGVIFTRAEDDSVAGDTNIDGELSKPQYGNAYIRGTGTLNLSPSLTMKYVTTTTSGTISSDQIWLAGQVYRVTGDVTVASGATLTIQPGAIVKFNSGKSLIVQSGGTLNAQGTVAQPIVFTSVKDDEYGGDTNEDDGFYAPQAGDWNQIRVQGTAVFDHAIVRYTGNVSGSNGAFYLTSGSNLTFNNSILEFSKYYALSSDSGTVNAQNSVFRESQTALVNMHSSGCYARFVNCTFADSSMFLWCGWGNTSFTNCIAANITNTFVGLSNSAGFQNCVFYNPKGSGPQSFGSVGSNGNIWANPLFRNAAAGDYYLMAGSPCIDAGTAEGTPETDITGAPRAKDPYSDRDGVVDIGAYEFVDGVSSSIDLEPVNVQAPASVTTGETVTIQWTIRNNGSAAAQGTWTDAVYLVNENSGQSVLVKEYTHSGSISPGDLQTFYTDVVIPTVADGTWKVQLRANPNREIFEGVNVSNNAVLAEAGTTVQTPFLTDSDGTISTKKNQPAIYRVTVQAGDTFNLQANSDKPVSIYMRENYVPSASNYDFKATEYQTNNYTLYIAPADTDRTFYLLAETASEAASVEYTIETGSTFAILGITPTSVSNAGSSTITASGLGFTPGMTAELVLGDTVISASAVNVTTASSAALTFDLTSQPGGKYALRLTSPNGQTDELADALTVEQNGIGAKLEIDLQLPESVRPGRVYEAQLVYENKGDCDMFAPIFTIFSEDSSLALDSESIGIAQSLVVLGLGQSDSAGILRPGDSGSIHFYFQASSSGSSISYNQWFEMGTAPESDIWNNWNELFTDISNAATILGMRGVCNYSFTFVQEFAEALKNGNNTTGFSGTLYDHRNGTPLNDCLLISSWFENGEKYFLTASTDKNGNFAFNYLPKNAEIQLSLWGGAYSLSEELIFIGESDLLNYSLAALPYGSISGRVTDSTTNKGVDNLGIFVQKDGVNYAYVTTNSNGQYSVSNLPMGEYQLYFETSGKYITPELQDITIYAASSETLNVKLDKGSSVSGTVLDTNGDPVADTSITISTENQIWTIQTDAQGCWSTSGLTTGTYTVTVNNIAYLPVEDTTLEIGDQMNYIQDFELQQGASISGTVLGNSGNMVSNVIVYLVNEDRSAYTVTDENGHWEIKGLPMGEYKITLYSENLSFNQTGTVSLDSLDLFTQDFTWQDFGAVSGKIQTIDEKPIQGRVIITNGSTVYQETVSDVGGNFVFNELIQGEYRLYVPGTEASCSVCVTPNIQTVQNISLCLGTTVTGQVIDIEGNGIEFASVEVYDGSHYVSSFTTDLDGMFNLNFTSPGVFSFYVTDGTGVIAYKENVTIQENSTCDLVFTCGTHSLNILPPTGIPEVYDEETPITFTLERQSDSGDYVEFYWNFCSVEEPMEMNNLPDGNFRLSVSFENYKDFMYFTLDEETPSLQITPHLQRKTGLTLQIALPENSTNELEETICWLYDSENRLLSSEIIDEDGIIKFFGLEKGTYTVVAINGALGWRDTVTIADDNEECLNVIMSEMSKVLQVSITADEDIGRIEITNSAGQIVGYSEPESQENITIHVFDENDYLVSVFFSCYVSYEHIHLENSAGLLDYGTIVCKPICHESQLTVSSDDAIPNKDYPEAQEGFWEDLKNLLWPSTETISEYIESIYQNSLIILQGAGNYLNSCSKIHSDCGVRHPEIENYNNKLDSLLKELNKTNIEVQSMRVWINCINDTYGNILGNLKQALTASVDFLLDWNTVVKSPLAMRSALDLRSLRRHPNLKIYVKEGKEYLKYIGKKKLGLSGKDTVELAAIKGLRKMLSIFEEIEDNAGSEEVSNGIASSDASKLGLEITTLGKSKNKTGNKAFKNLGKIYDDLMTLAEDMDNFKSDWDSAMNILTHTRVLLEDAKLLHNLPRIFSRVTNVISQTYNALKGIYENAVKAYNGAKAFIGNSLNFQWSTDELVEKARKVLDFHDEYTAFMNIPIPVCTCTPSTPPLKVSKRTESSLRVIWSEVPYATGYKLVCSNNGLLGQQTTVQGTSYTFTGLNSDTQYHMKIKVVTRIGESDWGGGCTARTLKAQDPNEMIGPVGADFTFHDEGTEDEPFMVIDGANWIYSSELLENEYKIYFENKTSATTAAQEITVTTTLPKEMDWSTFQVDEIAIGNEIYTLSDDCLIGENTWLVDQTSTGEQIKIRFDFDAETGEAKWYLRSYVSSTYDNFPVSAYDGFLPPNDENHSGEGYITYHVKYDSDLSTGDVISTSATIIFDTNEAIETNVWLNTIDVDTPVSEITGYETSGDTVTLSWTGSDVGSGVAAYDLYVSVNGGNFTLAAGGLMETSYTYAFEEDGPHSFKVVATDAVGNTEVKVQSEITVTKGALSQMLAVLTTQETSLDSHAVSATETPISEWDDVYVEMWHAQEVSQTFTLEYNSTLYTLDTESCRTQEGVTLELSDEVIENGMTTLTVSLDASNLVTNGENTLLAALKLMPNNPKNNLAIGESAEGVVSVNGNALATTVYSVIYDLNESGSVEINDLVAFARLFGQKTAENPDAWKADFNCDERVDISDLVLFARNFGSQANSANHILYSANYAPHVEDAQPAAPALPALETSVAWETPTWSGTTQNLEPAPALAVATVTDRAWNDLWSELEEEEEERLAAQRRVAEFTWE
ncbi:MAG: carboxypeptidase regulatory-like domain-containing protein [Thermoguttaceae bacterium]|nr:carboxypeptidase regulatory-like domain-containing protein [Thermoguttaceae bacterium]